MAHWIAQYDGPDGWKEITTCHCSECDGPAPLVLDINMDGIGHKYKLSKYCIFCDASMDESTEYIEKKFI